MPPRPSLASPPAHLPRPPGREWSDDNPAKRARRDGVGGRADEEKSSDEIIKERLRKERPCRTLFVRNVEVSLKYRVFLGMKSDDAFLFSSMPTLKIFVEDLKHLEKSRVGST
jgi:hypothetical protein